MKPNEILDYTKAKMEAYKRTIEYGDEVVDWSIVERELDAILQALHAATIAALPEKITPNTTNYLLAPDDRGKEYISGHNKCVDQMKAAIDELYKGGELHSMSMTNMLRKQIVQILDFNTDENTGGFSPELRAYYENRITEVCVAWHVELCRKQAVEWRIEQMRRIKPRINLQTWEKIMDELDAEKADVNQVKDELYGVKKQ